jgi:hypothetical protein
MPMPKTLLVDRSSHAMHLLTRARGDKRKLQELHKCLDDNKYTVAYRLESERKRIEGDLKRIKIKTASIETFPVPAVRRKPPERPKTEMKTEQLPSTTPATTESPVSSEAGRTSMLDNAAIDNVMTANTENE